MQKVMEKLNLNLTADISKVIKCRIDGEQVAIKVMFTETVFM